MVKAKAQIGTPSQEPGAAILKTAQAAKLNPRGDGLITYQLGRRPDDQPLIKIAANDSGGKHSKEWVPLSRIIEILEKTAKDGQFIPSSALAEAFNSRSQNNSGFLMAALRAEGILAPVPDKPFLSMVSRSLDEWLTEIGTLEPEERPEEPIEPENIEPPESGENGTVQEPGKKEVPPKKGRKKARVIPEDQAVAPVTEGDGEDADNTA